MKVKSRKATGDICLTKKKETKYLWLSGPQSLPATSRSHSVLSILAPSITRKSSKRWLLSWCDTNGNPQLACHRWKKYSQFGSLSQAIYQRFYTSELVVWDFHHLQGFFFIHPSWLGFLEKRIKPCSKASLELGIGVHHTPCNKACWRGKKLRQGELNLFLKSRK